MVVANGALTLGHVADLILKAVPEDVADLEEDDDAETLVESGHAAPVLCRLLSLWGNAHPDAPAAAWKQSDLRLQSFLPKVICSDRPRFCFGVGRARWPMSGSSVIGRASLLCWRCSCGISDR